MSKSVATLLAVVGFSLVGSGSANAFLRIKKNGQHAQVNSDNLERTLLEEIEGQVGNANIRGRLARLEASLHPMFLSLPKNEHGNLDHSTVRYALHRLFVQRHGWYIKGLDNAGQSWNETSHANILKDHAADFVQSVFEHRLGDKGLNLHELAVLGATLEHLIHDESVERLEKAFALTNHDINSSMSFEEASEVTTTYMKLFILGDEIGSTVSETEMNEIYPGWEDTKTFAVDILRSSADGQNNLNFNIVTKSVEEIAEQYGRFQDGECRVMKTDLVKLGDMNIGRVPLSEFYRPALEGVNFQFMESVDYLRSLGALDETDPNLPSVIVPNYVGSQSNCVVSSSYYSVCCIDECEGLTSQLEKEFQSPEADPKEVLAVVAGLSSSTVTGPRELSAPLIRRLEDIAEGHHGTVPLHGRLFTQWMHHAFPRECPFPHVSGTTNPAAESEWIEQDEMQKIADASAGVTFENVELTHWTHEEELLVPRAAPRSSGSSWWGSLRNVMFLSALVAVGAQALASGGSAAKAVTLCSGYDGKAGKLV